MAASVSCGSTKKTEFTPAPAPTTSATTDSAAEQKPPDCVNPTPINDMNGAPSGFVNCEGGVMHRTEVHTCPSLLPRSTHCGIAGTKDAASLDACHSDSECTLKPNGFCGTSSQSASCFCNYGCTTDAECGAGFICQCKSPVGECIPAKCTSDADCNGLLCLRSLDILCGIFACQDKTDPCTSNADCSQYNAFPACLYADGKRKCGPLPNCR